MYYFLHFDGFMLYSKKIDPANLAIFYQVINIIESDWTLSLEH